MATLPPPVQKTLCACVFVASLVGAALGVYSLDVATAVLWLIAAEL
jgi:hypothetical protein